MAEYLIYGDTLRSAAGCVRARPIASICLARFFAGFM